MLAMQAYLAEVLLSDNEQRRLINGGQCKQTPDHMDIDDRRRYCHQSLLIAASEAGHPPIRPQNDPINGVLAFQHRCTQQSGKATHTLCTVDPGFQLPATEWC